MTVTSVMVKNVFTVKSSSSVGSVWKLFTKKKINSAPVVDSRSHLIGIVTKEDMLQLLYPDYRQYLHDMTQNQNFRANDKEFAQMMQKKVSDIMNKHVIYTEKQTPAMRALARMIARRVNQLPVIDEKNHVIGIVTKGSIFNGLYRFHRSLFNRNFK